MLSSSGRAWTYVSSSLVEVPLLLLARGVFASCLIDFPFPRWYPGISRFHAGYLAWILGVLIPADIGTLRGKNVLHTIKAGSIGAPWNWLRLFRNVHGQTLGGKSTSVAVNRLSNGNGAVNIGSLYPQNPYRTSSAK
jgi:hypothetical protein